MAEHPEGRALVLASEGWHPGVIGIVAIWYFGWARKTFKGPIRTIEDGVFHELEGLEPVAPGPTFP